MVRGLHLRLVWPFVRLRGDVMEKNIKEFVNECANRLAQKQIDDFVGEIEMAEEDGYYDGPPIDSPIEQIFLTALLHNIKENDLPMAEPIEFGNYYFLYGINIHPQFKIGKYFVDFKIDFDKYIFNRQEHKTIEDCSTSILVECDSQEWHERTEKERRYEKARDRYFIKQGYKVFHYTGKEIIVNSFGVASEILKELTVYNYSIRKYKGISNG